jgi:hypothetical protein
MEVPPAFFFENAPTDELTAGEGFAEEASTTLVMDFFSSAEGIQLNRAFSRIEDPKVRRKIVELIKALSPDDTDK